MPWSILVILLISIISLKKIPYIAIKAISPMGYFDSSKKRCYKFGKWLG
jgi:hypothetical protein